MGVFAQVTRRRLRLTASVLIAGACGLPAGAAAEGTAPAAAQERPLEPIKLTVPGRASDAKGTLLFDFKQRRRGDPQTLVLNATPSLKSPIGTQVIARLDRDLVDTNTNQFITIKRVRSPLSVTGGDLEVATTVDAKSLSPGKYIGSLTIKSPPEATRPVEPVSIPIEVVLKGGYLLAFLACVFGVIVGVLIKGAADAAAARKTPSGQGKWFQRWFGTFTFWTTAFVGVFGGLSAFALTYWPDTTWGDDGFGDWIRLAAVAAGGAVSGKTLAQVIGLLGGTPAPDGAAIPVRGR